jgi:hypothetical protein
MSAIFYPILLLNFKKKSTEGVKKRVFIDIIDMWPSEVHQFLGQSIGIFQ